MSTSDHKVGRIEFAPVYSGSPLFAAIGADGKVFAPTPRDPSMRWADDPQVVGIPNAAEAAAQQAEAEHLAAAQHGAEVAQAERQLRDHFASQVLPALMAHKTLDQLEQDARLDERIARVAFDLADAMMAERARRSTVETGASS